MTPSPIPAGQDPYVVFVKAEVAIEKLVYATDLGAAEDIANQEAAELSAILQARTGLDLESPWVTVESDARVPYYQELFQSSDPEQYPPLEPYFPTLVRDPRKWPDEDSPAPDFLPPDFGESAA